MEAAVFLVAQAPQGSRPLYPVPALGSGVVSVGMLLLLPVAVGADPSVGPVPAAGTAAWWAVVAVLLAQAVVVAWAGRAPAVVLPLVPAVALLSVPAAPGAAFSFTAVAVLVAVFLAFVARPARPLWPSLVAAGVVLAVGQFITVGALGAAGVGAAVVGSVVQALLVIGMPLLVGSVIAARQDVHEAGRQELAALRREQEALLEAAVSRQRTALSRELHDIAAHHLSGIAMMAAAVARQIDTDPATAKHSVTQIREQSRAVLADLRRLVGLLREEAGAVRPVETLGAVTGLVETWRAAGVEVELLVPAHWEEPGPLAQLVAYRMVQESLANVAAHAPGASCTVEVGTPVDGRLAISVRNGVPTGADPGPGGGFGLVGMAERAQLVAADLRYGPTPDGGWEVRLSLPLEEAVSTMAAPATVPEVHHDPRADRR
ncbi:sensor histidine kinase [Lentzea sp. CA-135723]|uniref:sensor histidine kinase n=1 Tax=Lentzea sp. CA-135723 TaxID=3239950 RepID=UPI003D938CF0